MVLGQFKSDTDRPNMFGLQRSLLTNDATLVLGGAESAIGR